MGRSWIVSVATSRGRVWIKHSYGLPPGEEVVLGALAERWADRLPTVVARWPGGFAAESLRGEELRPDAPLESWVRVARGLAELQAGEAAHADAWLAAGVRDRRPPAWGVAVRELLGSAAVGELEPSLRKVFEECAAELVEVYASGFGAAATLVPQDSGCCNVHLDERGPVFFDWSDVVVGHPMFSCDRLLDQVPAEHRESVIGAFLEPLGLERAEFDAMRKSNVLHEIARYHDELEHLGPGEPTRLRLSKGIRGQLEALARHYERRR